MRPYTEYADRLYLDPLGPAHIVPWNVVKTSLCGITASADEWWGTGDWNETEHAAWLPVCHECLHHAGLAPKPQHDYDPAVTTWRDALASH